MSTDRVADASGGRYRIERELGEGEPTPIVLTDWFQEFREPVEED